MITVQSCGRFSFEKYWPPPSTFLPLITSSKQGNFLFTKALFPLYRHSTETVWFYSVWLLFHYTFFRGPCSYNGAVPVQRRRQRRVTVFRLADAFKPCGKELHGARPYPSLKWARRGCRLPSHKKTLYTVHICSSPHCIALRYTGLSPKPKLDHDSYSSNTL